MKILLVSLGPVPHQPKSIVEGGGLRVWGLANALLNYGHDVKIAIPSAYLETPINYKNGIELIPYRNLEDLQEDIYLTGAVIYPTGAPSIANAILALRTPFTICIGDSYVPIHVEVASRSSKDVALEEHHFRNTSPQWLNAIGKSDILICASEDQKIYLLGLLSGSGYLTPMTYKHLKILVVPFGLDPAETRKKKRSEIAKRSKSIKILWYGGFYPWFDGSKFAMLAEMLLDQSRNNKIKIEIIVVGASNPFVNDPTLVRHAAEIIENLKKIKNIQFVDWLPYNERHQLLEEIDLVFCFSQPGFENLLSWRTRYLDFIKFRIPVIINNIDPLGRLIIGAGAGLCMDSDNLSMISSVVEDILDNPLKLQSMKTSYAHLENLLTWNKVIRPLIEELKRPIGELVWQNASTVLTNEQSIPNFSNYLQYFRLQVRANGWNSTVRKSLKFAVRKFGSLKPIHLRRSRSSKLQQITPKYVIFTHQLNYSGSPKIAINLAKSVHSNDSNDAMESTHIYSFGRVEESVRMEMQQNGIAVSETLFSPSLINPKSILILNGLAFPHEVFDHLLLKVKEFVTPPTILVHEDRPQMYIDSARAKILGSATRLGFLRIVTPSKGTQKHIQDYLGCSEIELIQYPLENIERNSCDYSHEIRVHLTGTTGDRRKNHLQAIDLVHQVVSKTQLSPHRYRQIKLVLIGVDEKTTEGQQIFEQSRLIQGHIEIHPPLDFTECFKIMQECNAVMCLSEYEALPLFVAQSMGLGHLVFRNNCSGVDEQLKLNKNGIAINYFEEYSESVNRILELLDKRKTTNRQLEEMSNLSRRMVEPFLGLDYRKAYGIN